MSGSMARVKALHNTVGIVLGRVHVAMIFIAV